MNEDLLIQSAQNGDLDAFNELILRYQNLLFSISLRILGDEDTAENPAYPRRLIPRGSYAGHGCKLVLVVRRVND